MNITTPTRPLRTITTLRWDTDERSICRRRRPGCLARIVGSGGRRGSVGFRVSEMRFGGSIGSCMGV